MQMPPDGRADARARESTGLAQYYATLRAHVKLIVLCTIVTFAAAVAYVKLAPKSYTATAQMVVAPIPAQDSALETVPGLLRGSGDPTTDILTAASEVHTQQIAQATVTALHLKQSAAQVLGAVSVVPTDQSNILSVSTSSSDPRQAQRLVNGFADQIVAVRSAKLHAYVAREIPQLKAALKGSPAAAATTTTDLLGQLQALQNGPDPTITVSAPATVPTAPTSPKTSLSLVAGLLVGLLIGIAAAFGIETLDPPVRREGELRRRFGAAPVLAQIPQRSGAVRAGPLLPMDLSAAALEQYRAVRAALRVRPESNRGRAFLVSSATPGEGKSTSAICLAAMFAQGGADVILIDADLRRPAIAQALGDGSTGPGTEDVLSGEVQLSEALRSVRLGPTRLRVLPARGQAAEHADRLSPASAAQLVQVAGRLADIVILDSPPLATVSDALPFAQAVDEVLLVVRMGVTKLSKLSEAWERLGRQRTQPSGIIVVGVREQSGYGYGYYLGAEESGWRTQATPVSAAAPVSQARRQ